MSTLLSRIRKNAAALLTLVSSVVMLGAFFLTQPWSLPNFGAGSFPGGTGGTGGGAIQLPPNFTPPANFQLPPNFTPPANFQLPPNFTPPAGFPSIGATPGAAATQAVENTGGFKAPAPANATPQAPISPGAGGSSPTAGAGTGGGFPGGAGGFPGGAPGGFFTIIIGILSNPLVLLVPIGALIALIMALWRLNRKNALRLTAYLTVAAGVAALIYYVLFFVQGNKPNAVGFWIAGLGAIALIVQYPLARRTFPPRVKYAKLEGIPARRLNLNLGQNFAIAIDALMANKLRSGLTMLGVVIGVMSVVSLLSVGRGAQASITEQISGTGLNIVTITSRSTGSSRNLTVKDADAIEKQVTNYTAVLPQYGETLRVRSDDENILTNVTGVTPPFAKATNLKIDYGRFISQSDYDNGSRIAILGKKAASDLYGGRDPIGKEVRLGGQRFEVVGVLAQQDSGFGQDPNSTIYVPLSTAYRALFNVKAPGSSDNVVSSVRVAVDDTNNVASVKSQIELLLRERHKLKTSDENDFNILDQQSLLNTASTITGILTVLLGAIASVSLLVGGIGIMNISLVSVTERTKEIGLRKAIGARKSRILMQFLIETIMLSTLGGIIGVLCGVGIALLVNASGLLSARVTADSILLGLGFSIIVGVFFGVYPATRAAALQPIEALRYE